MDEQQMISKEIEEVGAAATEETAGAEVQPEEPEQQDQPKKYTDTDVDRIVARKIAAERKRMTKLFNEEQQETEIQTRERNVLKRELRADAKEELIADGLPASLADLLNYGSKDDYDRSYEDVTRTFREAMHQEYVRQFSGPAPKANMGNTTDTTIRNAFAPKAR